MTRNLKWQPYAALLIITFVLALHGCSSAPKAPPAEGELPFSSENLDGANDSEVQAFRSLEGLYRQKKFNDVIARTKTFIKNNPKSNILDRIYFVRGLSYLQMQQSQHALINFRHVSQLTKDETIRSMALYNKGFLELDQGQLEDAIASLEAVKLSSLPDHDRRKYYLLLAKINSKRNDSVSATHAILQAFRYSESGSPESTGDSSSMRNFLQSHLESFNSLPAIDRLLEDFSDTNAGDELYNRAITISLAAGDRSRAIEYAKKLISYHPNSTHYSAARSLLARTEASSRMNPGRVGVVLTLSGKFAKFGYKALQGIQLAFGVFNKENSAGLTLMICDDRGEEAYAAACVDRLADQDEVALIIGPLLSKAGDAAGLRAQEKGVPLITLTQKEADGGDYIFNAALTPAMQVRELIRVSQEIAGVKSYAVLSPSSKFGEEYSTAFWDAATDADATINGFENYPPNETDFRFYIDRLVGLAWPEARGKEIQALQELKAASNLKINQKRLDKMFTLKPIIDFQAVFLPDDPKRLGQILPTFAYKDVDKMLYLGINTWNSPELISRAGAHAEGSIFVDAFFPGSTKQSVTDFIQKFTNTYNYTPGSIEAISYDAGNLAVHTLAVEHASSRSNARDKLANLRDFPGVMGKISYISGKLTKRLAVLTVKGGKIEEIAAQ